MTDSQDNRYWADRAEMELIRARAAATSLASKLHYELAGLYLDRAHGGDALPDRPPTLLG